MIDFLLANMTEVVSLVVAIIMLVYALFTKQWALVKSSALSLMLSAERLMKTKPGEARMKEVFDWVWNSMPAVLRKFTTEEKLRALLQKWYNEGKDILVK